MMKLPSYKWKFKIVKDATVALVDQPIFQSGDEGKRVWEGGIILSRFIAHNSALFRDKRVLELGTGGGITGISILKFTNAREVVMTDYKDSLFPLIESNLSANAMSHKHISAPVLVPASAEESLECWDKLSAVPAMATRLESVKGTSKAGPVCSNCTMCYPGRQKVEKLDWTKAPGKAQTGFDVVVGSDIIYKGSHHDLLCGYLKAICTGIV